MAEDPRRTRSRASVVAAAAELLLEHGADGLTIEAVAARSGVAKTTIYRHFTGRVDLHIAALSSVTRPNSITYTDDLVGDVTAFCLTLDAMLHSAQWAVLFATAMDGAERSPSMAAILRDEGEQRRTVLVERLTAARASGALPDDAEVDVLTSQLVGPLFYRRFISRQDTGPEFVTRHVHALLGGGPARSRR